ncbi:uncharacterized protein I303_107877 [Kwoniella dejecticola CBS 10117]|uniref:Uncharacterized protein n=1 Tax=Kwoniella dejecticola CBS 10117 TaxID=1296121 RepID=A0A1A5ZVZ0_9TREE|nr:uncharacterized protein I303_07880 [Kwoniella dejecticola CBS 10117]OBR81967.1 hypothetical protein I303_07880 [Kwoniella dejecticola CBS 10117]
MSTHLSYILVANDGAEFKVDYHTYYYFDSTPEATRFHVSANAVVIKCILDILTNKADVDTLTFPEMILLHQVINGWEKSGLIIRRFVEIMQHRCPHIYIPLRRQFVPHFGHAVRLFKLDKFFHNMLEMVLRDPITRKCMDLDNWTESEIRLCGTGFYNMLKSLLGRAGDGIMYNIRMDVLGGEYTIRRINGQGQLFFVEAFPIWDED